MYRTDNPIADFMRYDADRCNELEKLPLCEECWERIQDEHYYEINDVIICLDCMEHNHRRYTDEFGEYE